MPANLVLGGEGIGTEDVEEIPSKGVFVEYQPPPGTPPSVEMLNVRTGQSVKGIEVVRRWMKEGKLENVTVENPSTLDWPFPIFASQVEELEWNLGTPVAPVLVELYVVDGASFDPHKHPRELNHLASCHVNGDSFEGHLPFCSSRRDEHGRWIIATPAQYEVEMPLKVILSAWWRYIPESFLSNPDSNKELESEIFWGTWIFTLSNY